MADGGPMSRVSRRPAFVRPFHVYRMTSGGRMSQRYTYNLEDFGYDDVVPVVTLRENVACDNDYL